MRKRLYEFDTEKVYDKDIREAMEERFSFVYERGYLALLPVKVSVSELKKKSMQETEEEPLSMDVFSEPEVVPLVPSFVRKKEKTLRGADRGTAYHRMMECLDYEALKEAGDPGKELIRQREALVGEKRLLKEQADSIDLKDMEIFLTNPVGHRLALAGEAGMLKREQPFVFARPARELSPEWPYDEKVLVQGIIDAYFFEEDEIVLVDYKTDRIRPGEEEQLALRYRVQLDDYAAALESMTGRHVKERYLYSFTLGKEIPV